MQDALPALLGTHDFRCFETNYPNKATSVRTILDVSLERRDFPALWLSADNWRPADPRPHEDSGHPMICFEIEADGFLYNMVRAIVGTLLRIGTGQRPPAYIADVIAGMDRNAAGSTAAAQGLYLVKVDYPESLLQV